MSSVRRALAAHSRSWLRWFRREYRDAVAALRGIMQRELPKAAKTRLDLVDTLLTAQKLARLLEHGTEQVKLGRDSFGTLWNGSRSNWSELSAIVKWEQECREEKLHSSFRQLVARLDDPDACRKAVELLSDRLSRIQSAVPDLFKRLRLDVPEAFGSADFEAVPLKVIRERLRQWQENSETLSKWVAYWIRQLHLRSAGLSELVERLQEGAIGGGAACTQFELAYHETLLRHLLDNHPQLATFDGETYEQWIAAFQRLDVERIELARVEVATAHFNGIPRSGGLGELAILRREIEKKRKHKPIRLLLKDAGNAIIATKPVFMMSPLSVAQFLTPGSLSFDLLLIDEASQVSPVDALGAMARAQQVIVVGDSKQLPPTRFFAKMLDDDSSLDDENALANAGDLESILGLCVSQGMLPRMLRWHYRSRHHSLIAVSNREFYESKLWVVPSPTTADATTGLRFRFIDGGVFDRGGTRANRIEAQVVARAVVEHGRRFPSKSLGVGCFSVSQRDAIRDELELLLRQERGLDHFFATGRPEPFFVKNLENIQGDERDVIFISIGYARDSSGFFAMSFGPLATDGGERRLNVLISRARERCEVFSCITADDIDLERGRSRGTAALKTFLRYAQKGILDDQISTGRGYDSGFEKQVADALAGLGYVVHCQIGTAGFLIDLAVVDSDRPGRYLLGIECDGATYHSSRSARDRDRLREQVLRDRGWRIHRIWSTDWFHRPQEQLRKVVAAIEKARIEVAADDAALRSNCDAVTANVSSEIERDDASPVDSSNAVPEWVGPYREADFSVPVSTAIHALSTKNLADIVVAVVSVEEPIHRDEIARRITTLWGQQRTGSRISEAVSEAIEFGCNADRLTVDGFFVSTQMSSHATTVALRNREAVKSVSLRRVDMIPSAELRFAVHRLVADHVGIQRDELHTTLARLLGFRSTSAQLKSLIETEIDCLVESQVLAERDRRLFAVET